jgi:hypothetical protein
MAFDTRQMTLAGPAAVAVHDDGDVARQPIELDLPGQRLFRATLGNPLQQLIEAHWSRSSIVQRKGRPGFTGPASTLNLKV